MTTKDKMAGPLVVERTFQASVSQVWKALTNVEALRQWYFDLTEFRAEEGFEFSFTVEDKGVRYCHRCRVTEVQPPSRLAYTWRYEGYEGDSLVTFELFPEGTKTRVKLTHSGLETFPKLPAFAPSCFDQGWNHLLGISLKNYLETGESDCAIVVTREFNAARELVWEAMTNPRHVVNWWGPHGFTTTVEVMDFRVGGVWKHVMHGPNGTDYPNKSIFLEIVPLERVVYSHAGGRQGGPGHSFVAYWTFESLGPERSRLTMRLVFRTPEDRDLVIERFNAQEGGKQTLQRLADYLEGPARELLASADTPAATVARSA